ncbi:unnamed protein product [Adineta steineri]|uniref:Centrosomin N-terminal motif 1 domain-containing protein n=1 Tax=Adineta steineri TaxID=433720 RepID=A0A814AB53_9BILA|nr:unnamed protein product [Adineta steineri]CAF0911785.1 unnamed protein product [Adineta steineri]CAF0915594.1 unnamed protein product [Adineta steineri]CAF3555236.1 unnamed protein product [Adineta steineri]CAF3744065.1 unnamed protein product [Adineta steineri]
MDHSRIEDRSSHEINDGSVLTRSANLDLSPSTNAKTMREIDSEVQELKRENFQLKLRIYFLEEQNETSNVHTSSTQVLQQCPSSQIESYNKIEGAKGILKTGSWHSLDRYVVFKFVHNIVNIRLFC